MSFPVTRRRATGLIAALAAAPLTPASAQAPAPYLNITPGSNFQPVPVAVTAFLGDPDQANMLTQIITNNFSRSVFIAPLSPSTFPAKIANFDTPPQAGAWRAIGAQFVVTGQIGRAADGRLQAQFRLFDVSNGQQVAGQQYVTDPNNSRRVAHIISDAIFTRITGEKGVFDSRIVFVDETGSKLKRIKRLAIMDQDSANVRYLTRGDEIVVTPRFSPSSQDVAYMAFGSGDPKVYLLDIENGQSEIVGNFPSMTFSPRFSPDGQKIILSLSEGAASNLFTMDLRSRATTRLTDSASIDTSPCYSPDGTQIAFESDRGGTQQIYLMSASGGPAQRITFGQNARYSEPIWSPKGDLIAFTRQRNNLFGIGVMKPDGSGERMLTEGFYNEGPTFAPNGLYVMWFRDPGGAAGPHIFMGDIFAHAEFPVPTPNFASDPAWSPLLK